MVEIDLVDFCAFPLGKHVFCEKPLAPTVAAVKECYKMAEEKGKALLCAFNRRFDPQHQVGNGEKPIGEEKL